MTSLLRTLSMADAMAAARDNDGGKPSNCVVLRQATLDCVTPFLMVGGRDIGLNLHIQMAGFDAMMQDAFDSALWRDQPDWVIVAPTLERFAPEVAALSHPVEIDNSDIVVDIESRAIALIDALRQQTTAKVLWLGFAAPLEPNFGLAEARPDLWGQLRLIEQINGKIQKYLTETGAGSLVSVEACIRRIGSETFFEKSRRFQIGSYCTAAGGRAVSIEVLKHMRLHLAKQKKVLALDCDNTLWGGLAGEVDPKSIGLATAGFPDAAHLALQATAKRLKERGILLVLVSKNEPESVWAVFDQRDDMILKRSDIAGSRINWTAKSVNLRELAIELNLGLDSFVFVDDNPAEIEEVHQNCPEVSCLLLDKDTLVDFPSRIAEAGWFETFTITASDSLRNETYQTNKLRDEERAQAPSLEAYLKSLSMIATVKVDQDVDMERAAQMCQRTNQFNLTTKRYGTSDIEALVTSPDARVIMVGLQDRFGQLGDIGLAIVDTDATGSIVLDTMLLSCRAFGRHVEDLMLQHACDTARQMGAQKLEIVYSPTPKNKLVRDYLSALGHELRDREDGSVTVSIDCEADRPIFPDVFAD